MYFVRVIIFEWHQKLTRNLLPSLSKPTKCLKYLSNNRRNHSTTLSYIGMTRETGSLSVIHNNLHPMSYQLISNIATCILILGSSICTASPKKEPRIRITITIPSFWREGTNSYLKFKGKKKKKCPKMHANRPFHWKIKSLLKIRIKPFYKWTIACSWNKQPI